MKVYTKTGDSGKTSLIGGKRVPKYHERIEAYGTVDELVSYIGLIRDFEIESETKESLIKIQSYLMSCGSILASDSSNTKIKIPSLEDDSIQFLEDEIDNMENELPELTSFILPGGHKCVSFCHIARNICRKAERRTAFLAENETINANILIFLNRLSDYLFVLSRHLAKFFKSNDIIWKPNL